MTPFSDGTGHRLVMERKEVLGKMRGIAHGITGWLSFQGRCKRREAYSEYFLYGPIIEIALSQGWNVKSEFAVDTDRKRRGDKKRIDFCLSAYQATVGIEVKWVTQKKRKVNLENEIKKLRHLQGQENDTVYGFIFLAGVYPVIKRINYEPVWIKDQIERLENKHMKGWRYRSNFKTDRTNYGAVIVEIQTKSSSLIGVGVKR